MPFELVIITAFRPGYNPATGHLGKIPILSFAAPSMSMNMINWKTVIPSDSLENFLHRMDFKRYEGLGAIQPLTMADV